MLRFNTSTIHLTLSPCTILKMTQMLIAMCVRKLVRATPTVATTVISKRMCIARSCRKKFHYPFTHTTLSCYCNLVIMKLNHHTFFAISVTIVVTANSDSFCCKQCNFKIDLDCARMLLNFEHIQHVSQEHWLTLICVERYRRHNFFVEYFEDVIRRQYYRAACREVCYGDTYCCKRCYFFLHKSCAEYPTEIQLSLHLDHPLKLQTGTSKFRERCDFCEVCNFKIDFTYARMLLDFHENDSYYIKHYSHRHDLSINKKKMNDDACCCACKNTSRLKVTVALNAISISINHAV